MYINIDVISQIYRYISCIFFQNFSSTSSRYESDAEGFYFDKRYNKRLYSKMNIVELFLNHCLRTIAYFDCHNRV